MNEQFLVSPELFPARISGEVWGAESATIELAGELYRVEGLSPSQRASLQVRYGPRMSSQLAARSSQEKGVRSQLAAQSSQENLTASGGLAPASCELRAASSVAPASPVLRIFRAARSDFREIDTRGWDYSLDIAWSEDAVTMSGLRLMARADLASSRGGLWTCVDSEPEFWGVFENVLRPILAARLLANGGLLVHSASVDGWLFPSPSGGGKSTIARMGLNAGLPVLSDDLNAIGAAGAIVPLPFTGDLDEDVLSKTPMTIRGIVALEKSSEKGDREAVRPLPLAEAISLLIRCAPYVNQDPHRTTLLLDRAADIASSVPRAVLTFRPGSDVWPILASRK